MRNHTWPGHNPVCSCLSWFWKNYEMSSVAPQCPHLSVYQIWSGCWCLSLALIHIFCPGMMTGRSFALCLDLNIFCCSSFTILSFLLNTFKSGYLGMRDLGGTETPHQEFCRWDPMSWWSRSVGQRSPLRVLIFFSTFVLLYTLLTLPLHYSEGIVDSADLQDANCGPLSVTSVSGIPNLAKITFSLSNVVADMSFGKFTTLM